MENKGRYLILDGLHRLLKYKVLGYDKVKVRVIPRDEIPNISKYEFSFELFSTSILINLIINSIL